MKLGILQILPRLGDRHLHLLARPAEDVDQRAQRVRRQGVQVLHQLVAADLLDLRVLGPRVEGQLEDALLDVDEARLVHPALHVGGRVHGHAELVHGAADRLLQAVQRAGGRVRAVVRGAGGVGLLGLEVAAGLQVVEALAQEARPVGDAGVHVDEVDQVERLVVRPLLLGVVDDELEVRRHP